MIKIKREIKFRLWDTSEKEFVDPKTIAINGLGNVMADTGREWVIDICKEDFILMQYTGLKDKNERDIYEGDIITLHQFIQVLGTGLGVSEGEQELTGKIEINDYGVYFNCTSQDDSVSDYLILFNLHEESLEIIGNIYENPELLK